MNILCDNVPFTPVEHYDDPNIMYGKDFLITNYSSYPIRVKMYILPKFALSSSGRLMHSPHGVMVQELIYNSGTCRYGIVTPSFDPLDPDDNDGPLEICDHVFGTFSATGLIDIPFWDKYPGSLDNITRFRVAFIEFWIEASNINPQKYWLALEDNTSFNENTSILSGPLPPVLHSLTFPFSGPQIYYYLLDNELNPTGGSEFPYVAYYLMNGVSSEFEDMTNNIKATFRYMPNIITPSYPHANPDTTPGYILKFESTL